MRRADARRTGFTLVELLVVIAIITVLIAIALPVFSRVRESARRTACMANLHQIAMAERMYRLDMGHYPGPYDPVTGEGGLNALYPAYLDNRKALVCPDDLTDSGERYVRQDVEIWLSRTEHYHVQYHGPIYTGDKPDTDEPYQGLLDIASTLPMYMALDPTGLYFASLWQDKRPDNPGFFGEHYSSYNTMYNWVGYVGTDASYNLCDLGGQYLWHGDNLGFWYMWYRWDPENKLGVWSSPDIYDLLDNYLQYALAQQTYWYDYDPWNPDVGDRLQDAMGRPMWDPGNPDPSSWDYMPYGLPSASFPGLINPNAPDNTIITRCIHHRSATRKSAGKDDNGNPIYWEQDIVLRLDGSAEMADSLTYDWASQPRATK
jgi:prepilin-type N-terminal cleavage/methylation domain-containing protein